jgi:hypothetical protein
MYNPATSSEFGEFFDAFAWAVPTAFSSSLNQCRFERGDIFYDTPKGYLIWEQALKHLKFSVQVRSPAHSAGRASNDQDVFGDNWKSEVAFTVTDYKNDKSTREVTTTQGRLYTLLWQGDWKAIEDSQEPEIPLTCLARPLFDQLNDIARQIKSRTCSHIDKPNLFVMPYDPTHPISASKYQTVKKRLTQEFTVVDELFPTHEFGLRDTPIVPTVSFAAFLVDSEDSVKIFDALKEVLYKPAADRKTTKDKFRLSAHGAFQAWQVHN